MDKAGLRARIRANRRGRTPSPDFVQRVLAEVGPGTVCCYVALPGEPPTEQIIEALLERAFLPVAADHGQMHWVPAASSRPWLAWGINGEAPSAFVELPKVATVIVPALAVTPEGQRLGQGRGYYDRFLPTQPHAHTVALVWSDEVVPDVFAEPHDVPVDTWVIADG